jgi:hypothetical protein
MMRRVVARSHPGEGEILLVVGATELTGANLAECVPRRALDTALGSIFRRRAYSSRPWDAAIAVAEKTCPLATSHPAVFAQILAHEYGHATVAVRDPDLHTYCSFLDLAIRRASAGRVTMSHELPHERAFDGFGNLVAIDLFGITAFKAQVADLAAQPRPDRDRLSFVLGLAPRVDVVGLRREVQAFAAPYRVVLERMWATEASRARAAADRSITQQASRPISALWEE